MHGRNDWLGGGNGAERHSCLKQGPYAVSFSLCTRYNVVLVKCLLNE